MFSATVRQTLVLGAIFLAGLLAGWKNSSDLARPGIIAVEKETLEWIRRKSDGPAVQAAADYAPSAVAPRYGTRVMPNLH